MANSGDQGVTTSSPRSTRFAEPVAEATKHTEVAFSQNRCANGSPEHGPATTTLQQQSRPLTVSTAARASIRTEVHGCGSTKRSSNLPWLLRLVVLESRRVRSKSFTRNFSTVYLSDGVTIADIHWLRQICLGCRMSYCDVSWHQRKTEVATVRNS